MSPRVGLAWGFHGFEGCTFFFLFADIIYEDDSKFKTKSDDSKRENTLGIGHDSENENEVGDDKKV